MNIACYRDPECLPTISDLFQKALHPDRINVGVVLQTMPSDRIAIVHDRVRVRHVDATRARGPCWARALGYSLWQGESHVLQTDSHMRFVPGWDVLLMEQLAACPSRKAMLTTYPPGYEPPDQLISLDPSFLAAKRFDERGILIQQGVLEAAPLRPRPTAFIAAGFLFGPSDWIKEVPYDPNLYFHGEEATLALRLWTHGWDFFGPTRPIVWHYYGKSVRPLHWEDDPGWSDLDTASLARMRHILGMVPASGDEPVNVAGYGLGAVRSRRQYKLMSGIDFRAQTIAPHALAGDFSRHPALPHRPAMLEPAYRLGPSVLRQAAWPIYR